MCWIKLHRRLLDWEWSDDTAMFSLWVHLLMMANYEDKSWHGEVIPRGSLITTRGRLAEVVGISEQQVRTCLTRLRETKEVDLKSTNKYTIITICKYDDYQIAETDVNQQITNKQPTNNQQITKTKEIENKEEKEKVSKDTKKKRNRRPSSVEEVREYCLARKNNIDPQYFFDKNESTGWVDKNGNPYSDWKAVVRTWEKWNTEDKKQTENKKPRIL